MAKEPESAEAVGATLERKQARRRAATTRICCYLLAPALLATLLGFGARWHWTLELATHFPVQIAIALIVPLSFGVWLRKWWIVLLASACLLYNAALIAPLYLPADDAGEHGQPLKFLLANVHTGNREYDRLLEFVEQEQPDVIVLLETDVDWIQALSALDVEYPHSSVHPRGDNFGMAVFSKLPLEDLRVIELADSMVPTVLATIQQGPDQLTIIATHPLPPVSAMYAQTRDGHLAALAELAKTIDGPLVVLGDLNTTSWSPHFPDLLEAADLRDSRQGFGVQPTWPLGASIFSIPLDHVLINDQVAVLDRWVGSDIGSDHRPVVVEIAVRNAR